MDWDQIGQKITGLGRDVSDKVKETAEVARLRQRIRAEEEKLAGAYQAIGKLYYEKHDGEICEEYIPYFEHVGEACAAIEEFQGQLNELKKRKICPECGAAVEETSAFCSHCGHKMN
ncbi:zinc-ribbon domain-containing protein [Hominifimenecus sp. rT4P-3]|uniref:zinc-ribbon domain-containing protein n=1 Tax=Hominifimenecus sp. rT4P-3 TaxID=3242979 RepID=UPI003DA32D23